MVLGARTRLKWSSNIGAPDVCSFTFKVTPVSSVNRMTRVPTKLLSTLFVGGPQGMPSYLEMIVSYFVRYHLRARRELLASGRNETIPVMPFHELCTLIGDAIKAVPSESIKKSFRHTLFSLPPDGSKDSTEEGKRITKLISEAPAFEDLPDKYQIKVCW